MMKWYYWVPIPVLLLVFLFLFQNIQQGTYLETNTSPDGEYKADIYLMPQFFATPGQGGRGSKFVNIVVKNKWGKVVSRTTTKCTTMLDNLKITWETKNHKLYFAPARILDLKTGRCEY